MKEWRLIRRSGSDLELGRRHHIHPAVARVLINRRIVSDEDMEAYLHWGVESLRAPEALRDMDKACEIVTDTIRCGGKIRIIGDYDIDGVCATAILLQGLRRLGGEVDGVIPHRILDGYGVNVGMIHKAAEDGVSLILTCDNGISAIDETALARDLGMKMVITDHHEPRFVKENGEKIFVLPEPDALVDPKQPDCTYPWKSICGGYIAFKLICRIYDAFLRDFPTEVQNKCRDTAFREDLLQLAAFATVGDIMELLDENRPLVKEGLRLMNSRPCHGLKELIEVQGLGEKEITAYHVGFVLGPALNAAGRLDSAEKSLKLLMTDSAGEALELADELKRFNETRKSLTEKATEEAVKQIEGEESDTGEPTAGMLQDKVLVVYLPGMHESIAGIVAGRLRERYNRPTLVITDGRTGAKGSGRSIPAYNMAEALMAVQDIFTRFGGHAQAAGFSLPVERIGELRQRLNENCTLEEKDFREVVRIDLDLPPERANGDLIDGLKVLEPIGNGNEKPCFARAGLRLVKGEVYGKDKNVARYTCLDGNKAFEFTLFHRIGEFHEYLKKKSGEAALEKVLRGEGDIPLALIYTPQWNEFRGVKKVQLIINDFQ